MKSEKYLLLVLMVLLVSCTKDKNAIVNLDKIPIREIHLEKMNLEDAPLFPRGCCLVDSSLVLFDSKDKDGFLSIYNLEGQLLGKYGTKGNGPNDFVQPKFISNGKFITANRNMHIGDSYYFLCWDDTRENIKAGKAKTKIYKTDSSGNIQEIMQLDKSVSYFCLNQSHLYAIGISEENLDLEVYYADIKKTF